MTLSFRLGVLAGILAIPFAVAACSSSEEDTGQATPPAAAPTGEQPSEEKPAEEKPAPPKEDPKPTPPAEDAELFGKALTGKPAAITIEELVADPEPLDGQKRRLEGIVRSVCMVKGCWMEVRPTDDATGPAILVRFKGYSFFMPKDSRGAHVTFEGEIVVTKMTAEQVEHHESEGGVIANKNPDGSATTLMVIATGVEMTGR